MTDTTWTPDPVAAALAEECRIPFSANVIGKLPRVTCPVCSDRDKNCTQHAKGRCSECNQFISTAHIHIDFVGHAPLTARLIQLDPGWEWKPMAYDADGSPLIKVRGKQATMWIWLTIRGITHPGVGIAPASKEELEKELIGDALRNAAMRFGLALDLWAKGDLIGEYGEDVTTEVDEPPVPEASAQMRPTAKKAATRPKKATGTAVAKKVATPRPAPAPAPAPPPKPAAAQPSGNGEVEDPNLLFKKVPREKRQEAMAALVDNPVEFDPPAGVIGLWPFPNEKTRGENGEPISAETLALALEEVVSVLRTWAESEGIEL